MRLGPRAARACFAAILSTLALALSGPALRGQAKPAARHDIPFSTQVVTPHVPWATRLPGGPVRGFFVPPVTEGRDMVELMERLSLEPTTVTIDRNWDVNCWGIGDYYDGEHVLRGDRDDFRIVYGYVEEELASAKPFEVLVIPGLNGWSRYTRKTRDAILRRVSEGAGLVLLHPFVGDVKGHPFLGDEKEGDGRIWEISPLVGVADDRVSDRGYPELNQDAITQGQWTARPHPITEGLDLDLLPSGARGGRFYRYQAKGDVVIEAAGLPVVATRTYGKGRVVAFATVGDGLIPEAIDPVKTRTYWDYWEYEYSLLARAVLWAARGEAPVRLKTLHASPEDGITVSLASASVKSVEIEATTRSETGDVLGRATQILALAGGEGEAHLASAEGEVHLPGGRSVVDVVVRDPSSGATLQWGWAGLDAPKTASLTGLRANATVYREDDTMSVVARAAGDLAGLAVRVRFADDLGRLRAVEEAPARGERTFFHELDHALGKRVVVSAELVDAKGRLVDTLRHDPIVVAARERRRNDYRGLLSFETPVHYFAGQRLRLLRGQAMDTGFTWGGDVNDELHMPRGWFGVYWYDRGPTTPEGMEKAIAEFEKGGGDVDSLPYLVKKELYRRTGETRFLVRTPSFDDPLVGQRLFDLARTSARSKAVYNMDYYFVGDEGSLGSYADPVDFCWGKHTLAAFREWLQKQYGSLESLNREWGSAFSRWDDVLPLTTEAARREGRYAPWADHRTYMEVAFARAYQTVRNGVVEGDPEGHIALSGTQVTTPWNGCDWHRLDAVVDDFLSYAGGNQWDIHRSFAKPGARIGFWTGYGRSGAPVQHEVWTAALQGVLHPQLFWSPSIFNADMTFSRSGRDLGAVFRALRFEGVGRLLMEAERLDDAVAVHYSMPSVHAAGILGHHPRREEDGDEGEKADRSFPANRDGWVNVLDDLGVSFRFVATPQVEEGALRGRKVLVLPYSLALSDREAAEIRRFVEEGGLLLADAGTGLFDEHVAWRQAGALDELFGIQAPPPRDRVRPLPRVNGPVGLTADGAGSGLRAQDLAGLEALEPTVHAGAGKALARFGRTDVAVVNHVGRGTAVYLNALLDRRQGDRAPGGHRTRRVPPRWEALVRAVLAQAGVRPAVSVTDPAGRPVPNVRVARYRLGAHEVVALLSGDLDVRTSFSRDGVTVYEDAALGRVVRHEVDVSLPGPAHVTNVRTGEDLGETGRLHTTLVAGDALVLSLGPARTPLRLEGPTAARRGEHAAFTASEPAGGRRLLRWHVLGPDGALRPEYSHVTVEDRPQATFTLPTALNDTTGEYRIRVADVLTGASAETTLRLE
jgi:hypothetical protein